MMTREQKQMKAYMHTIERRLNLPREAGQTDEQIYAEMGSPETVAAELSEQMKEYAFTRSKWRWAALAAAILAGAMLVFEGIMGLMVWLLNQTINSGPNLGIIGGADGPTAIFVTTSTGTWDWLPWALVLGMSLLGWWKLGHLKGK